MSEDDDGMRHMVIAQGANPTVAWHLLLSKLSIFHFIYKDFTSFLQFLQSALPKMKEPKNE